MKFLALASASCELYEKEAVLRGNIAFIEN